MELKEKLTSIAKEGFEQAKANLRAAYEESEFDEMGSLAERYIAAQNVYEVLTGPIPDDLAHHILKYDNPFSMLQDRLYMSRDVYKPSYYQGLLNEIQGLLDPLEEIDAVPEHENELVI